ncbi:hypothetical protein BJV74DRAFT_818906 [Russula compacta]|nr:hypothetical protein BJV74DRAFT_818906 [Russula compacta]
MFSKHLKQRPFVPLAGDDTHQGLPLYRDVGHGLRRGHSQKTRSFRLPTVYSNSLTDLHNWDTMFMERLMGGITMHKPAVVPAVVLSLGNGFDFWAINAAQKWLKCRVIAHSLLGMHKDGMDALIRAMRLTDRVTYVRGDPSRDLSLNFPDNTFDMVRLSYCSLNLAETEWYVFLQEVNRVLKPGGVLEIIDEDLLFPGHRPLEPNPHDNVPSAQQLHPQWGFVPPSSLGSALDTRSIDVKTTASFSLSSFVHSESQHDWNRSEVSFSSLQYAVDPVDHSKLTRAWHEMLTSRWISASITSVLPFYLSAIFQDLRALPALEIYISPSSTRHTFSSKGSQQMIDPGPFRRLTHATVKDDADSSVTWIQASEAPPYFIPSHAQMHLARMVAIVASCKEAIWGAYNKLYSADRRLPRLSDKPGKTNVHTIREEFEYHWLNWECDMRSQINMASDVQERLQWVVGLPPPEPDSDCGRWLKSVKDVQSERDLIGLASPHPVKRPEAIRCVRGFVARKFCGSTPETSFPVSKW